MISKVMAGMRRACRLLAVQPLLEAGAPRLSATDNLVQKTFRTDPLGFMHFTFYQGM